MRSEDANVPKSHETEVLVLDFRAEPQNQLPGPTMPYVS